MERNFGRRQKQDLCPSDFSDQQSRQALDPLFLPLDNSSSDCPDWYEFWPIRNYLRGHELDENGWYGFLSPRFVQKTGIKASVVLETLIKYDQNADVALFSPGWDQLAYFLNPFEQGEVWHPGLLRLSQEFFDGIQFDVSLSSLVTHTKTSVFSNYIIAKPHFWRQWLALADAFYHLVESGNRPELRRTTNYGSNHNQAHIRTFIQERFASVILARGNFQVICADQSQFAPIFTRLFSDTPQTRRMLQTCDLLKERFCLSGDSDYLEMYEKIRGTINFRHPQM